jgi:hypothetical protein
MAYNRQPQTVLAGMALKQNPQPTVLQPAGIVAVTLDADLATTTSPGVVQVGSGLSITPSGILSATGGGSDLLNVKLTSIDYTATATDYYIGATKKDIEITLPLGVTGKVYIVKNQVSGNIKVKASGSQKIDTASDKTLGTESSIIVVFDGTRWNII